MVTMLRVGLVILWCAAATFAVTPDERTLARQGIEPNHESIARYLQSLFPDDAKRDRIERLVALLGSRDPAARDHAVRELMRLGPTPLAALERAAKSEKPEVRRQARMLLESADRHRTAETLFSVFRVIRARKISGLVPELLRVIPIATDSHVRHEARGALVASARTEDLDLLVRTAADGDPLARMACFAAIREVGGDQAPPILRKALTASSEAVRLAAAFELANLGDRKALAVLVELLGSPNEWIRYRAVATLRAIARKSLGYAAGAPRGKRTPKVQAWRDWLAKDGKTVRWETPLRWFAVERGRTLVATYTAGKVVEFDDDGKVVWSVTGIRNPWAVRGLPNGHRLLSSYSDNVVYEYDAAGKRIWTSERLPGNVCGIDRLANGNIVVAISSANQILEIARDKKIVSKIAVDGNPVSVRALSGGNLLVALHGAGKVVEIDREGRVKWRAQGFRQPYSAKRLPSGNVLVASYGGQRIVECDRSGTVVWERRKIAGIYTAERLPDGSLIFADKAAVYRYRADGEMQWRRPLPGSYLYLDRY